MEIPSEWKHSTNIYEVNVRQYTKEGTFKAFYGYVIPSFLSSDMEFDKGIIIYDYTISNIKEDLYNALLPIKKEVTIYYSLEDTIINKIL